VRIADDRDGVNLGRGSRRRLVSMASEATGHESDAAPRQDRFERRPDLFGDCSRGATVLVFRMTTILRMMSGAVACREHFMRLGSDIVAPARAIGLLAARAVVPGIEAFANPLAALLPRLSSEVPGWEQFWTDTHAHSDH
jgi:hypothetical protein